jgi:hypothetical protein
LLRHVPFSLHIKQTMLLLDSARHENDFKHVVCVCCGVSMGSEGFSTLNGRVKVF